MLDQSTVWIVTEEEVLEVDTLDGQRSSVDVGGGFEAVRERIAVTTRKRLPIPVDTLKQQMAGLMNVVAEVFSHATKNQCLGIELDEIELSVEVNAEGQVSIIGTGSKVGGKGAITLRFKRVQLESLQAQQPEQNG
ncbi:hypothetical protein H6G64_09955 [Calothrix sp. FACHB-156]|nr:hypothetical protein [Calothrix sp. FACHB-156]